MSQVPQIWNFVLHELRHVSWRHDAVQVMFLRLDCSSPRPICSENTEPFDGNSCFQEQLCRFRIRIVVNKGSCHRPSCFSKAPLDNWLEHLNTGCPLSEEKNPINSSVELHLARVCRRDSHANFSSSPGMRKVHRPSGNNLSQAETQAELCLRTSSLHCWSQSISLYIDTKMIRPLKLYGCVLSLPSIV